MLKSGDQPVPGYRLEQFIGKGNFGEVWKAKGPGGTWQALKFIDLEQTQGRKEYRAIQSLKRIKKHVNLMEINAIWLLDDSGRIIPDEEVMRETVVTDSVKGTIATRSSSNQFVACTLVFAMPLAEKNLLEVLEEYKKQGKPGIPLPDLLGYMADAAEAIDFLNTRQHDLGGDELEAIYHCDIKPANLMLVSNSIVLGDFGVSRTMNAAQNRKTSMSGTVGYMAPECIDSEVTPYSDQFSLAFSYVELRTGKLPFDEDASPAVLLNQRLKGILDLSLLDKKEAEVIRKATSVKPESRYKTTVEFVKALYEATLPATPPQGGAVTLIKRLVAVGILAMTALLTTAYFVPSVKTKVLDLLGWEPRPELHGGGIGMIPIGGEEIQKWKDTRDQAEAIVMGSDQQTFPQVDENEFDQAVELYSKSIQQGLPETEMSVPDRKVIFAPSGNLFYLPEDDIFAIRADGGIAGIINDRTNPESFAIGFNSGDKQIGQGFARVSSFGWLNEKLMVLGESADDDEVIVSASPDDGGEQKATLGKIKSEMVDLNPPKLFTPVNDRDHLLIVRHGAGAEGQESSQVEILAYDSQLVPTNERASVVIDNAMSFLCKLTTNRRLLGILQYPRIKKESVASKITIVDPLAIDQAVTVEANPVGYQINQNVLSFDSMADSLCYVLKCKTKDNEGLPQEALIVGLLSLHDPNQHTHKILKSSEIITCALVKENGGKFVVLVGLESGQVHYFPDAASIGESAELDNAAGQENSMARIKALDFLVAPASGGDENWIAWASDASDGIHVYVALGDSQGRLQGMEIYHDPSKLSKPISQIALSPGLSSLIVGDEKGRVMLWNFTEFRMKYRAAKRNKREFPKEINMPATDSGSPPIKT